MRSRFVRGTHRDVIGRRRLEGWLADSDEREHMEAVARKLFPCPAASARHADLHVDGTGIIAEPEVRPQVVLREEAPARADLAHLLCAAAADRHFCADGESVSGRGHGAHRHPVVLRRLPILQQRRGVVRVADDEIEIAVVVEISDGKAAADRARSAGPRPRVPTRRGIGCRGSRAAGSFGGRFRQAAGICRCPRKCGRWRRTDRACHRGRRRKRRRPSPCERTSGPAMPAGVLASSKCRPSTL